MNGAGRRRRPVAGLTLAGRALDRGRVAGLPERDPHRLRRPQGFRNPGGFDYERWLFVHDIGATGYVRDASPPEHIGDASVRV